MQYCSESVDPNFDPSPRSYMHRVMHDVQYLARVGFKQAEEAVRGKDRTNAPRYPETLWDAEYGSRSKQPTNRPVALMRLVK